MESKQDKYEKKGHLIGAELELWLFDRSGRARNMAYKVISAFEKDGRPRVPQEISNDIGELHFEFDQSSVEVGCRPSQSLEEVARSLVTTLTAVDTFVRRFGLHALPYGVRLDGTAEKIRDEHLGRAFS
jgi:nitroreductase